MNEFEIRTDVGAMIRSLDAALQKIVDLTGTGLSQAEEPLEPPKALPGTDIQFSPWLNQRPTAEQNTNQFRAWILANGFRDATETIGTFLEDVRQMAALWTISRFKYERVEILGDDWNQRMVSEHRKFHRCGLPDKIDHLTKEYDLTLEQGIVTKVRSINQARNCLVHRGGVVSSRDADEDNEMIVQWLRLAMYLHTEQGKVEMSLPFEVPEGATFSLKQVEQARTFPLNSKVEFCVADVADILWTINVFGRSTVRALVEWGRENGLDLPEVPTQDEPAIVNLSDVDGPA